MRPPDGKIDQDALSARASTPEDEHGEVAFWKSKYEASVRQCDEISESLATADRERKALRLQLREYQDA